MLKFNKKMISILSVVCCVAILSGVAFFAFGQRDKSTDNAIDYKIFIEHYRQKTVQEGFKKTESDVSLSVGNSRFEYDAKSGDFTVVTDKGSYKSSIAEANDTDETNLLQSSLVYIEYFDKSNNLVTMSSRKDSLKNGGAELYVKENTLRILYTMGKDERTYFLPLVIRAEVFEEDILPKLEGTESRKLKKYYRKYEVDEKLTATEKNELIAKYPRYKDTDIYVYIGGDSVKLQSSFESIFRSADFDETDYNEELTALDAEEAKADIPAIFFIPIEFTLGDDTLSARVINEGITVSDSELYLVNIHILPYFGSSSLASGYMILPDGGGSYVDLSNSDIAGSSFKKQIYGSDLSLKEMDNSGEEEAPSTKQQDAYIPSYIFSSGAGSYAATAACGAEYASVNAKVKGKANVVNTAGFSFTYRPYQIVETGNTDQMVTLVTYSKNPVKTDFEVLYQLTGSAETEAKDMLSALKTFYQEKDYLPKDSGIVSSKTLFIDMYCLAVDEATGKTNVLSTFSDIENLLKELNNRGITDCVVTLKAISSDGIDFSFKNQLKASGKLGGVSGLRSLAEKADKLGYRINLSWNLCSVYTDKMFDGFSSIGDAVKNIEQLVMRNNGAYVLSPDRYDSAVKAAERQLKKLVGTDIGITFENSGLNSNFNKKSEALRETVISSTIEARKRLSDGRRVAVSAPYLPFAESTVTDLALNSSHSAIQTSEFPLVAYLYNGNTLYSGQSISLADDPAQYSKTVISSGAALKVSWMIAEDTVLMNSDYSNSLYSLCYKDNIDDLINLYLEYNKSLSAGSVQLPKLK